MADRDEPRKGAAWLPRTPVVAGDDGWAMPSLLTATPSRTGARSDEQSARTRRARPALLLALVAGVLAAGTMLLVCAALGLVGWFLSDAGVHGAPRDGMRTGALAWLVAHGSGLTVAGAQVTVLPLGLTALCAWTVWRFGHRLGESLWAHGPDAHRIADGERDWTVPVAVAGFATGYVSVAALTLRLAGAGDLRLDEGSVVLWCLGLSLLAAGPAIAVGSGRAAVWAAPLPPVVRHGFATAVTIVVGHLLVSGLLLAAAFLVDFDEAANMVSGLHTTPGETVLYGTVNAALLPNALLLSGSFLLGPGFVVGGATLVSPAAVVLGPLPMLPLLAALPETGTPAGWVGALVALPPLVAAVAVVRVQRRRPTLRWQEGALRGCGGGIVAGLAFAVLASLAGGSAGPGRMRFVGPLVGDVLVHAVTAFGLGGLVGGLLITWWQRRTSVPADEPLPGADRVGPAAH